MDGPSCPRLCGPVPLTSHLIHNRLRCVCVCNYIADVDIYFITNKNIKYALDVISCHKFDVITLHQFPDTS
jgi:hypothetical protein